MSSLKQGHSRASASEDDADIISRMYQKTPAHLISDAQREQLKDIPAHTVRRAWTTLAHLLLNDNALVAVMGCAHGQLAFAMSVLKPNLQFVGIDNDKNAIQYARKNFKRHNIEFRQGDVSTINLGPESVDAIVNNKILYEIYSNHAYSDLCVTRALEHHFSLLKTGGTMFIQDYVMPPPGQFVLMEFPDKPSHSDDFEEITNADLLEWYSESARSHDEYSGFFLEELPPRFPKTRLYRLPYKWAYEFMVRKHDRALWKKELDKEYAFFTERDFRKNLKSLGGRVLYTAMQWDDKYIAENFDGQFNLYNEDGQSLGYPPTSLAVLVKKINHKQSLRLSERRRSKKPSGDLQISTMRNKDNGELIDIVSRAEASADVLPYRFDEANQAIKIYLHEGNPRGLANAVPRGTHNLDGRYWSGHMIEAISVKVDDIPENATEDSAAAADFAGNFFNLKPFFGSTLEKGAGYYTDPKHIDEKIDTYYLQITESENKWMEASDFLMDTSHYKTRGIIREVDAQDILNAISVGLIPTSRLEIQIRNLFDKHKVKATSWCESPLQLQENPNLKETKIDDLIKRLKDDASIPYEKSKGSAGQIQIAHSIFVDEGLADSGGSAGISSHEMDFFLPSNQTTNIAVCLPLSKNINGEVMAGICTDFMPVPQRYNGSAMSVSVPSFEIPTDISSMDQAKQFVAEKFGVDVKYVSPLGPSYFKHIGVTPQRIFPFAVCEAAGGYSHFAGVTEHVMTKGLLSLCYWDNHDSFIKVVAMAYQQFCQDNDNSVKWSLSKSFAADHSRSVSEMGEYMNQGSNATQHIPAPANGSSTSLAASSADSAKNADSLVARASSAARAEAMNAPSSSEASTASDDGNKNTKTGSPLVAPKKKQSKTSTGRPGLLARLKGKSDSIDQIKNSVKTQAMGSALTGDDKQSCKDKLDRR